MNSDGLLHQVLVQARPRLIALLMRQATSLDDAEDALAAAGEQALAAWRKNGMPQSPEAWLLTTARRRLIDGQRRTTLRMDDAPEPWTAPENPEEIPDERLRLFLMCADPKIDRAVQAPLMLNLLQGLTVEQAAEAYLEPAPRLAQQIVRAKRRLRATPAVLELPSLAELPSRIAPVLEAIYALYARGWERPLAQEEPRMAREAERMAAVLAELCPGSAEALGLAALIHFCESRRAARREPGGGFVPLDEQDPSLWDTRRIEKAEALLQQAAELRAPGRFQWEATLQSAHTQRLLTGRPGWPQILELADALVSAAPTLGARVNRCAILARVEGPAAALQELLAIPGAESAQAYWALKGRLCSQLRLREAAQTALQRAAKLTSDPAVAQSLEAETTRWPTG